MTTKQQYIAEARAANPQPQYRTVNGESIELTDDEYEASLEAWAEMRVSQDLAQAEADAIIAAKRSAYIKLGLTESEISAILGE